MRLEGCWLLTSSRWIEYLASALFACIQGNMDHLIGLYMRESSAINIVFIYNWGPYCQDQMFVVYELFYKKQDLVVYLLKECILYPFHVKLLHFRLPKSMEIGVGTNLSLFRWFPKQVMKKPMKQSFQWLYRKQRFYFIWFFWTHMNLTACFFHEIEFLGILRLCI